MERDRGSATVVIVALMAVIVTVALAVVGGGAALAAHAKSGSTADLAALAAARADRDSRAQGAWPAAALALGCGAASEVARRNGAALVSCRRGPHASVIVRVESPARAWPWPIRSSARAGPSGA